MSSNFLKTSPTVRSSSVAIDRCFSAESCIYAGKYFTINHFGHDITGLYVQHKLLLSNLRTDLM